MDWKELSGALPVVLWILFLMLKNRNRKKTQEKVKQPEGIKSRSGRTQDPQEFKRDYEPIEPS